MGLSFLRHNSKSTANRVGCPEGQPGYWRSVWNGPLPGLTTLRAGGSRGGAATGDPAASLLRRLSMNDAEAGNGAVSGPESGGQGSTPSPERSASAGSDSKESDAAERRASEDPERIEGVSIYSGSLDVVGSEMGPPGALGVSGAGMTDACRSTAAAPERPTQQSEPVEPSESAAPSVEAKVADTSVVSSGESDGADQASAVVEAADDMPGRPASAGGERPSGEVAGLVEAAGEVLVPSSSDLTNGASDGRPERGGRHAGDGHVQADLSESASSAGSPSSVSDLVATEISGTHAAHQLSPASSSAMTGERPTRHVVAPPDGNVAAEISSDSDDEDDELDKDHVVGIERASGGSPADGSGEGGTIQLSQTDEPMRVASDAAAFVPGLGSAASLSGTFPVGSRHTRPPPPPPPSGVVVQGQRRGVVARESPVGSVASVGSHERPPPAPPAALRALSAPAAASFTLPSRGRSPAGTPRGHDSDNSLASGGSKHNTGPDVVQRKSSGARRSLGLRVPDVADLTGEAATAAAGAATARNVGIVVLDSHTPRGMSPAVASVSNSPTVEGFFDPIVKTPATNQRHFATPPLSSPSPSTRQAPLLPPPCDWYEGDSELHGLVSYAYESDEAVQAAIARGDDVNATNSVGITPLHIAVSGVYWSGMEFLIASGARCDIRDVFGRTALHVACLLPQYAVDAVSYLDKAADAITAVAPSPADRDGNTPLHLAALRGATDVAQYLLEHGGAAVSASMRAKNAAGKTPVECATLGEACYTFLESRPEAENLTVSARGHMPSPSPPAAMQTPMSVGHLQSEMAALRRRNEELEAQCEGLRRGASEAQHAAQQSNTTASQLSQQLEQQREVSVGLKKELESARVAAAHATERELASREAAARVGAELEAARKQLVEADENVRKLNGELQQAYRAAHDQDAAARAEIARLQAAVAREHDTAVRAAKEAEGAAKQLQDAVNAHRVQAAAADRDVEQARREAAAAAQQVLDARATSQQLGARLSAAEMALSQAREAMASGEKALAAELARTAELERKLDASEAQAAKAAVQASEAERRSIAAEKEVAATRKRASDVLRQAEKKHSIALAAAASSHDDPQIDGDGRGKDGGGNSSTRDPLLSLSDSEGGPVEPGQRTVSPPTSIANQDISTSPVGAVSPSAGMTTARVTADEKGSITVEHNDERPSASSPSASTRPPKSTSTAAGVSPEVGDASSTPMEFPDPFADSSKVTTGEPSDTADAVTPTPTSSPAAPGRFSPASAARSTSSSNKPASPSDGATAVSEVLPGVTPTVSFTGVEHADRGSDSQESDIVADSGDAPTELSEDRAEAGRPADTREADWVAASDDEGNLYYYNYVTGESTWSEPSEPWIRHGSDSHTAGAAHANSSRGAAVDETEGEITSEAAVVTPETISTGGGGGGGSAAEQYQTSGVYGYHGDAYTSGTYEAQSAERYASGDGGDWSAAGADYDYDGTDYDYTWSSAANPEYEAGAAAGTLQPGGASESKDDGQDGVQWNDYGYGYDDYSGDQTYGYGYEYGDHGAEAQYAADGDTGKYAAGDEASELLGNSSKEAEPSVPDVSYPGEKKSEDSPSSAREGETQNAGGSEKQMGDRQMAVWARFFENAARARMGMDAMEAEKQERAALKAQSRLFKAVDESDLEAMEALLLKGVPVNLRDRRGACPVHIAAARGNTAMVAVLCEQGGAELDTRDHSGNTPLHLACAAGVDSCVQYLLQSAAPVESQNSAGDTPLHLAAANGRSKSCEMLIEYGAPLTARGAGGDTALKRVEAMLVMTPGEEDLEQTAKLLRDAQRSASSPDRTKGAATAESDLDSKDGDGWLWSIVGGVGRLLVGSDSEGGSDAVSEPSPKRPKPGANGTASDSTRSHPSSKRRERTPPAGLPPRPSHRRHPRVGAGSREDVTSSDSSDTSSSSSDNDDSDEDEDSTDDSDSEPDEPAPRSADQSASAVAEKSRERAATAPPASGRSATKAANLGTKNKFRFDERLKVWVLDGAERDRVRPSNSASSSGAPPTSGPPPTLTPSSVAAQRDRSASGNLRSRYLDPFAQVAGDTR